MVPGIRRERWLASRTTICVIDINHVLVYPALPLWCSNCDETMLAAAHSHRRTVMIWTGEGCLAWG